MLYDVHHCTACLVRQLCAPPAESVLLRTQWNQKRFHITGDKISPSDHI
jgi:hypothetical protein